MTPNKNIRTYMVEGIGNTAAFPVERLLVNGMRTPDGTEIFSRNRHDYVTHEDKNGEHYMVDGGLDYERRSAGHTEKPESLSVYVDDDHEINRENFVWGTYGKNGDEPLTWKKLCDMSTAHIKAVLVSQDQLPSWRVEIFSRELESRR